MNWRFQSILLALALAACGKDSSTPLSAAQASGGFAGRLAPTNGSVGGTRSDPISPDAGPSSSAGGAPGPSRPGDAGRTAQPMDAGAEPEPRDAMSSDDSDDASSAPPDPPVVATDWDVSAPRKVGLLIGRNVPYPQTGLQLFGTDLGFSFEHDGKVVLLFGDTYRRTDSACTTAMPINDDMMATLPLKYQPGLPHFEAVTKPDAPTDFNELKLSRDGQPVILDAFKVPVAGFSDGKTPYVIFQAQEVVECDSSAPMDACPAQDGVSCVADVPWCTPAPVTAPYTCEVLATLCLSRECRRSVCVDTRSSAYDATSRGNQAAQLSVVDIARQHADDATSFDSVATWKTNVFSHPTVRTVAKFSGELSGNDYAHGYDRLLIWGRSGMAAEQDREARLYFATQRLPLEEAGQAKFEPQYFAGADPQTNQPHWTSDPAQAAPLAMDGMPGGSPHEALAFVGAMSISWLGAPINRWVMMYGGDVGDFMLADPRGTRARPNAGSIVMRFAEQPWGPWTPATPHLAPGQPTNKGDLYGPGGILYHPQCTDLPDAPCAKTDPYVLSLIGTCSMGGSSELGRLYAPYVIDPYTRKNDHGGIDVTWLVSTWNPYSIVVYETSFDPR